MLNEGLETLLMSSPFLEKQETAEVFRVGVFSPLCTGFILRWLFSRGAMVLLRKFTVLFPSEEWI